MSEFKFAMNLLKNCAGNACVSPLNIAHALGLVMLGSSREAREEVVKTLGHECHEQAHETLSNALKEISQKGKFQWAFFHWAYFFILQAQKHKLFYFMIACQLIHLNIQSWPFPCKNAI